MIIVLNSLLSFILNASILMFQSIYYMWYNHLDFMRVFLFGTMFVVVILIQII